jgi:TonB family protein
MVRGSVLHQELPQVSRGAQNSIHGRVKVSVQVDVDQSGKVKQARLESAGPSQYFARKTLEAARGWTFNPPQANGQPSASRWVMRFEFGRGSMQVFPSEIKP